MNWNQESRASVERAATDGDVDAQAALRIHEALDRIDASVQTLRIEMTDSFDRLGSKLEMLRAEHKQ